ncbi:hypothetical protein [Yoonia sp. SS1-5]|uniref:Uncharacterized protein n=1 Tax=Yoonia rhodophyticola TaxID=3137370 RepID=A0AAN0NK85_9RHOB
MKRFLVPKTIFFALAFGALFSLVIAAIGEMAVGLWGRPRGVAYGILGYDYWLGLSIYGLAMVFVFRAISLPYALITSLTIITVPTFLLLPERGEWPFLRMYGAAIMMCVALAAWERYRTK